MAEISLWLNNLPRNDLNRILQDSVDETEISFFLYDSSGELLLSLPESRELKESSPTAQVEPFVPIKSGGKLIDIPDHRSGEVPIIEIARHAALTALKMHGSAAPIYAGAPLHRSAGPRQLGASPALPALPPSALLPHAEMAQSDTRCLTEIIQHQEQVHGVLVGWIGLPAVEPQVIPLCKTIMRTIRGRIEDLMRLQEEMEALSSEILDNYRELDSYDKFSTQLAGLANIERVYEVILEQTLELVEAHYGYIFKLDKPTDELQLVQCYPEGSGSDALEPVKLGEGLIGKVAATGESILIEDVEHPIWGSQDSCPFAPPLMCCALQVSQDLLGVIVVTRAPGERVFTAGDLKILKAAALQSASAMMLQRTQAQLVQSQKITALGQLVASVAHDLNNPLTAVIGYTEILLRQATDATQRRRLELIGREAQRAASIVRNLLTFSRQRSQEKVPLNLNDVIQAAIHLRAEQAKTGIQIISDLAPELPIVMADFHQIQQVILNLVLNAEQAILQTEQRGRIEIRTQRLPAHAPHTPEQIKITVADNGPGMPPAVRERIFEPFFTTKKEGKGTGLGLSICKNIVDSHDGTIDVESTVGEGTCFFIRLPVHPVTNNLLKSVPEPEVKPPTSAGILVVDDEALIREMLRSGLEEQGYHVETASNGREALRKIRVGSYDLVLTDIYMPELDGISLHQQLQQDTNCHAKFILMTGNHTSDQSVLSSVPATVPCLLKPFQVADVLQKIREVLQ